MTSGPSVSQETAEATATRIREYWSSRGYLVRTELTYVPRPPHKGDKPGWVVRTDMKNGFPTRKVVAA